MSATLGGGQFRPNLKTNEAVLRDFLDRRFGIFIHWGPVTLTGQEIGWSRGRETPLAEFDRLYERFDPVKFDACAWVALAKGAGARYLVVVTKHHDGFSLWDTRQSPYNIMHTPFRRDVLREIADECRRQDILFGTYYSVIDSLAFGWDHVPHPPDPRPNPPIRGGIRSYVPFLVAQCDELIDRYGSKILWFDMSSAIDAWTPEIGAEVYEHFNRKDDRVLINSRLDNGVRGPERAQPRSVSQRAGDFETREQEIGDFTETPWENCAPMTDNWSWHPGDRAKSLRASIDLLLECVGGNGNFLYNFCPGPDGAIEPDQVKLMQDMGAWLARHGRSIYGTRGGPYRPAAGFVSTRMGSTVFLHLFRGQAEAAVPIIPARKLLAAKMIGGEAVGCREEGGRYHVRVDPPSLEELDTIVELTFDGDVMSAPIQTV